MKRVDNSDVNIKLDSRIVYLSNFNAKFYTVNAENFFIRKTQDNVISAETEDNDTEYYIKLDWNELVTLGEGVLQYKIVNNIPDSDRADLYFNKNLERTTEYYINSNVTVDPETEESLSEIIAELGVKIDTEIARSTSADTVHDVAIQDEVITRQQNVSDLTDLISANTTAIATKLDTSAFTEAINELDNRKLDASAYTPTDLSNYYTKSEVYNKTEVDNAIAAIDVSSQLSGYTQLSAFSAYSASVATQIEDDELATSEAINDLNSRLINLVDNIGAISDIVDHPLNYISLSAFTAYSSATETRIAALEAEINNISSGITCGDY